MSRPTTVKERIIESYDNFSKKEKLVAKYIVDNYDQILSLSSGEIAELANVSDASVVRFAKSMGYKGFIPLRNQIKKEARSIRSPYLIMQSSDAIHCNEILQNNDINQYCHIMNMDILNFAACLNMNTLDKIAHNIQAADEVYLIGIGSDRIVADYLMNYLPLLGIKCIPILEEGLGMKEKLLQLRESDYIIMSSYPTVQEDEYFVVRYAKSKNVDIALLTDSDLTAQNLGIDTYVKTKSSHETFYNSSVLSMVFCDLLLTETRNINPERANEFMKTYDQMTNQ